VTYSTSLLCFFLNKVGIVRERERDRERLDLRSIFLKKEGGEREREEEEGH
jgi:hypothetical protein